MAKTPAPPTRKVKFRVTADPGSEVYVAGSFNAWNPRSDRLTGRKNVYSTTLRLPPGRYEYKFVVNEIWCMDPDCPDWVANDMGTLNSVLVVE